MKKINILLILFIFLWIGLLFKGVFYSSAPDLIISKHSIKIAVFCSLLVVFSFLWLIVKIYRELVGLRRLISLEVNNLEDLLLDLRNGTKIFFKERRKFPRFKAGIHARISGEEKLLKVLDLSLEGALLESETNFHLNDRIDLVVYLPFFPQPIVTKVKVVRISVARNEGLKRLNTVGVEFQKINNSDKTKLKEAIYLLAKSPSSSISA
jgi:Tfp pilus assembly protein PilZ